MPTKGRASSEKTAPTRLRRPHHEPAATDDEPIATHVGLVGSGGELVGARGVPGKGLGSERVTGIQRARMLAAMTEVCVERGAGNVTVAHVVERAGVSRRTFYELFVDREACFLAAFDDAIARASRYVLDAYDPDAKWSERIRSALTALLEFLDVEHGAGQLLLVGSLGAGAGALERRQGVVAQITAVIDEGRTQAKAGRELSLLTAEGTVGGVISVLHARMLEQGSHCLVELVNPLMSMIVLPYLGGAVAMRELSKPATKRPSRAPRPERNPLGELDMRLTYRTVRVLMAVAVQPGSSNRVVAEVSEVSDQGQMSKLLARLEHLGLIQNTGGGVSRGEPNAWTLTDKGWQVQNAIAEQTVAA